MTPEKTTVLMTPCGAGSGELQSGAGRGARWVNLLTLGWEREGLHPRRKVGSGAHRLCGDHISSEVAPPPKRGTVSAGQSGRADPLCKVVTAPSSYSCNHL